MEIVNPSRGDWDVFLRLAHLEGWRVPSQEIELYRGVLSRCAFVLRDEGRPLGFVTAVRHQRSGWIGNLIVAPQCRRRGLGVLLFEHAMQVLHLQGVRSVWLTASAQGRPLYEERGFEAVDSIERWALRGGERRGAVSEALSAPGALLQEDVRVWGESRVVLLNALTSRGKVLRVGDAVALVQGGAPMQVLGPWISPALCPRENRLLLCAALAAASPAGELVADVLASSPLRPLLSAAGFTRAGRCDLMVHGETGGVNLRPLVAFASLGSMG